MKTQKPPSQSGCRRVDNCVEICDADPVYVEENRVRVNFANPRGRKVRKIEYDNCYDKEPNSLKADRIVGLVGVVDVIVELKGSDRKHACEQVESTLKRWRNSKLRYPKMVCLIAYGRLEGKERRAGRIPKMTSRNESMELDFLCRNKVPLWIRESSAHHYTFKELLNKPNAR
jgi:hypothetical protein